MLRQISLYPLSTDKVTSSIVNCYSSLCIIINFVSKVKVTQWLKLEVYVRPCSLDLIFIVLLCIAIY